MEQLKQRQINKESNPDNGYSIGIRMTQRERIIVQSLGHGNISLGIKIALSWAAHFHNLGLNTEMNLDNIGLVTVSTTDNFISE